jgi:hypothetical protein
MNKIGIFIDEKSSRIIIFLLVFLIFRSCSISSDVSSLRKDIKKINYRLDSIPSKNDIRIEGLRNEKRMIQSTDRRILDVNRENEIDNELKKFN